MRLRALWSLIIWAAIGVGSYVLGVQSTIGQRAEDDVLGAADFTTAPPPPLNLVSPLSIALVLAVVALIALASYGWRRALGVTLVAGVTIIASRLLKFWMLPRPELLYEAPNTFPSGHMTTFVVLVAALIWAVPAIVRPWVAYAGAILLCIVSWQLLEYGWHRPSDIYGAVALGAAAYALGALIRPLTVGRSNRVAPSVVLIMSAIGALIVALVTLAVAVLLEDTRVLLIAGQVGGFAVVLFGTRTFLRLANPS